MSESSEFDFTNVPSEELVVLDVEAANSKETTGIDEGVVAEEDQSIELGEPVDRTAYSGSHWKGIADQNWPDRKNIEDLDSETGFKQKVKNFIQMLEQNNVSVHIQSVLRPPERAYLMHYSNEIRWGRKKSDDIDPMKGVNIIWDHGDYEKSKSAATKMAKAFGLGENAALESNHTKGLAIDLKFDFSKNTDENGKNFLTYIIPGSSEPITKEILWDENESIHGEKVRDHIIPNIENREFSKAGEVFGVYRKIDSDVMHWSINGY